MDFEIKKIDKLSYIAKKKVSDSGWVWIPNPWIFKLF